MLRAVQIKKFKSLHEVAIPLGRITVLVGPNNAGKSSILQGIQFAVSLAQSLALDSRARWAGNTLSGTLSAEQIVYAPLRDVHALAEGGSLKQDKSQAIEIAFTESSCPGASREATVSVSRGKNKNIAVSIAGKALGEDLQRLEQPYSVIAPGLAGIPAFEEYRSPGLVRRAAARGDANSVLRNILLALRANGPEWSLFQERLLTIFPDVSIDVSFENSSDEHITTVVSRAGVSLPLDASGTGILQATQLLAYIGLYKPRLLILDEPDSHLHPDNQRKLMTLMQEVAEKENCQVIFSTHSRHLLDEASEVGATIHWISSGTVQPSELSLTKVLLELGALDAGDRLRNGATPYLVLTEDSDTKYLEKIIESTGGELADFQIWSYKSCSNLATALALAAFVDEHAPGTKVWVHVDRDYMTDEEIDIVSEDLRKGGLIPFVTSGVDIESHFLQETHLSIVFPTLGRTELQGLIADATKAGRKKSIETFINSRMEMAHRSRRSGEGPPNAGQISTEATARYEADPVRYRHGKTVLRHLRRLAQEQYGLNRNIKIASTALSCPDFEKDRADLA